MGPLAAIVRFRTGIPLTEPLAIRYSRRIPRVGNNKVVKGQTMRSQNMAIGLVILAVVCIAASGCRSGAFQPVESANPVSGFFGGLDGGTYNSNDVTSQGWGNPQ